MVKHTQANRRQFAEIVGKLPTICLSVFDHFMNLALKGLTHKGSDKTVEKRNSLSGLLVLTAHLLPCSMDRIIGHILEQLMRHSRCK